MITTVEETAPSLGSDETAVEEEARELARVAEQNMEDDIREQKELIRRLKAEADAKVSASAGKADRNDGEEVGSGEDSTPSGSALKRVREEEAVEYKLNIKEPEVGQRAIVTNRRVRLLSDMRPEQKSLAWGAFLFAAGVGAV